MKVPELRFLGCSGEWEHQNFEKVFSTAIPHNNLSRDMLSNKPTSLKSVHYGDILVNYDEILDCSTGIIPYIINDDHSKYVGHYLNDGDIIFADAAEDETVGKAVELVNIVGAKVVSGLHTIVARPEIQFVTLFLGFLINSNAYHQQLLPLMQGTKVLSISKSTLNKTYLKFPSLPEQTQIGTLFHSNSQEKIVSNISPYLIEGENLFVTAQKKPLYSVPEMKFGNQPRDGGYFVLSTDEKNEITKKEPDLEKVIKSYIGAEEFIKGKDRYCIWLYNEPFDLIAGSKILKERIALVQNFRQNSKAKTTNGYAKTPAIFAQISQPDTNYLIVPSVSSERRRYVPIGFMDKDTIASNALQIVPNADLFHFGVLTSNVHMAWMRAVCGRLESRYRYSKEIVYNTFPWCCPTSVQKNKIEETGKNILKARELYPTSSLANLYDDVIMPPELRKAHQENDKAVMKAYGFSVKEMTESKCVAELMRLYEERVGELETTKKKGCFNE